MQSVVINIIPPIQPCMTQLDFAASASVRLVSYDAEDTSATDTMEGILGSD